MSTRYSKYPSKANPGQFRVLVAEPIIHPKLGFPIGENVGFSMLMSEEQVELAIEAANNGEFAYKLTGEKNAAGYFAVEAVFADVATLEHA